MPETKEERQAEKEINSRIEELIRSGALLEDGGMDKLYQLISKEFPDRKINKRTWQKRLGRLIWRKDKEADRALQKTVRAYLDVKEDFCPFYPYIPIDLVKERAKWHRGITTQSKKIREARTLPGIGRISLDEDARERRKFKLSPSTFDNPFHIEVPNPERWSVMFLNGSNIGTRHGQDILGNVSRRALSEANARGDAAVIITNLICIDVKKAAGIPKVGRSLVQGDNVNPNRIQDPDYRKIVQQILAKEPLNEAIYRTPEELVDDILSGWTKISVKPDGAPEYRGPVYVVLGNKENELIKAATYWELRWWTLKKQQELRAKLSVMRSALRHIEKEIENANGAETEQTTKELRRKKEELKLREEALASQEHRTRVSNVATQEWHRFYQHVLTVVVKKIEKAIPNAKVIGQDTSYIEIGGKKIEVHLTSHNKVSDSLLANYAIQYGPKNLRGKMAQVVVICHPWALQFRATAREVDYDGKRGSSHIFVAPIAVDETWLREILRSNSSQDHPLARAVFTEGFKAGVLRLCSVNGVVNPDVSNIHSLENFRQYPRRKASTPYARGPKYIWVMNASDPHHGGRAKEFVTCNDPNSKNYLKRLGMAEACFELMREYGLCEGTKMPVHVFNMPDDPTQGDHFGARKQPHPHQLLPHIIEEKARKMVRDRAPPEKILQLLQQQIEVRGSDFPLEQIVQLMERDIEPNLDIYSAIVRRTVKSGLHIRGVGEFVNEEYDGFDTRNCGAVNFGTGNHLERTVEGELAEGPLYAKYLRARLAQLPEWQGKEELLEKLVASPLYSGEAIGWATLQIPGGHEYGFDFRATPTRMAGWGDTLLGYTRNLPMRGNYSRIFNNRLPVLMVCGDKHFCGTVISDYAVFHMSPPGTHTDRYGERGFPPNNTGVSFVGLPVDGPNSGPILVRALLFDVIKDFVEDNPRAFDWEGFLPNPA